MGGLGSFVHARCLKSGALNVVLVIIVLVAMLVTVVEAIDVPLLLW